MQTFFLIKWFLFNICQSLLHKLLNFGKLPNAARLVTVNSKRDSINLFGLFLAYAISFQKKIIIKI